MVGRFCHKGFSHFLIDLCLCTHLINFVAFVSGKRFFFLFQVLISLLIMMLYSQAQNKCTLSLGTQMRTQHTCKVELIGWKWIRTCELNFNYTSNTWIYFLIRKIRALQIKRFLWPPTHLLSPFPHSEVVVLRLLLFTQNVFLCPLKHIFYSLCVCVCLHRHGVYTLEVLLSA